MGGHPYASRRRASVVTSRGTRRKVAVAYVRPAARRRGPAHPSHRPPRRARTPAGRRDLPHRPHGHPGPVEPPAPDRPRPRGLRDRRGGRPRGRPHRVGDRSRPVSPACGTCWWCSTACRTTASWAPRCFRRSGRPARRPGRHRGAGAGRSRGGDGRVHEASVVLGTPTWSIVLPALLGCGVTTGLGVVFNTAGVRPAASVAVIGCGGVGQLSCRARIAGAATIIAIDPAPGRREASLRAGATHAIDPGAGDLPEAVRPHRRPGRRRHVRGRRPAGVDRAGVRHGLPPGPSPWSACRRRTTSSPCRPCGRCSPASGWRGRRWVAPRCCATSPGTCRPRAAASTSADGLPPDPARRRQRRHGAARAGRGRPHRDRLTVAGLLAASASSSWRGSGPARSPP